ncbi:Putative kinase [Nitrosotalea devaniterrae]|uniref:Kinase n=1 Tax=Nitrosotalea devaniterrae TaxID=1078905 RepID=A0A128A254_9ARCH|nr:Putative kinase [Candidatus Nitrosotalea devanaterra]
MIIIICGLPGVGKSTLAKYLAPVFNATILSSDKIRKELFPIPTYLPSELKVVYDVMIIIAKYLNDIGINCILDATFNREGSRTEVKKRLELDHIHIVECSCPEEIAISRLESRKDDYSDATISVYQKMKKIHEPVMVDHVTVDTTLAPEDNVRKIVDYISKRSM